MHAQLEGTPPKSTGACEAARLARSDPQLASEAPPGWKEPPGSGGTRSVGSPPPTERMRSHDGESRPGAPSRLAFQSLPKSGGRVLIRRGPQTGWVVGPQPRAAPPVTQLGPGGQDARVRGAGGRGAVWGRGAAAAARGPRSSPCPCLPSKAVLQERQPQQQQHQQLRAQQQQPELRGRQQREQHVQQEQLRLRARRGGGAHGRHGHPQPVHALPRDAAEPVHQAAGPVRRAGTPGPGGSPSSRPAAPGPRGHSADAPRSAPAAGAPSTAVRGAVPPGRRVCGQGCCQAGGRRRGGDPAP